jgi:hypothetical protein
VKRTYLLPILFLLLFFSSLGADPRGEEIMRQVRSQPTPKSTYSRLTMIIEDIQKGRQETRELEIYARREKGKNASVIRFLSPREIRGVALLVRENPTPPNDQWIYLPALKQDPRRVSGSQRNQSFLGTDFTYADLEGTPLEAWNHDLIREESQQGVTLYVIRSTPTPSANSPYLYVLQWIHKAELFPIRVEFYDEKGLLKELRVEKYVRQGAYLLIQESVMENRRIPHRTILKVEEQKVDLDLPEKIFTPRGLKEG